MWTTRTEAVRDLVFAQILLRTFEKHWDLKMPEATAGKPFDVK